MNRDDDNPFRDQPDVSRPGTTAAGDRRGGGGDDDGDDDHRRGRRHRRHRYYYPDDTQLYGTPGTGRRTQGGGGGGTQRNRLQDECDRGYEDGLRAGEKDARRGLSSDPQRWSLYRSGGETVNRANRPVDAKQAYRDCFLRGYEQGHRGIKLNSGGASTTN